MSRHDVQRLVARSAAFGVLTSSSVTGFSRREICIDCDCRSFVPSTGLVVCTVEAGRMGIADRLDMAAAQLEIAGAPTIQVQLLDYPRVTAWLLESGEVEVDRFADRLSLAGVEQVAGWKRRHR